MNQFKNYFLKHIKKNVAIIWKDNKNTLMKEPLTFCRKTNKKLMRKNFSNNIYEKRLKMHFLKYFHLAKKHFFQLTVSIMEQQTFYVKLLTQFQKYLVIVDKNFETKPNVKILHLTVSMLTGPGSKLD